MLEGFEAFDIATSGTTIHGRRGGQPSGMTAGHLLRKSRGPIRMAASW